MATLFPLLQSTGTLYFARAHDVTAVAVAMSAALLGKRERALSLLTDAFHPSQRLNRVFFAQSSARHRPPRAILLRVIQNVSTVPRNRSWPCPKGNRVILRTCPNCGQSWSVVQHFFNGLRVRLYTVLWGRWRGLVPAQLQAATRHRYAGHESFVRRVHGKNQLEY